ncbi:hypothetical protein DSCO28_50390 [Desulfosarcina ovata subsp. sediminis]|uniref:Uncharacterized protein n=1 Tax=Desulfosarcina ovata subsp. sediminis TaxID=885957 RepID=A0A5K7ZJL6_9BACT|nr:hypothetical protein [Desulfosarcina ovata]BBO80167.1 hypothetical protein DSCO28_07330 [Desulfosarcina ovata subsp. sediminis]BBO84473.1 hypothetical protein DSCO28_50390 [Desulfosarcina ovata subsp. sediminis]
MPLLFDGMGGVNAGIVDRFFRLHGICGWRERDTLIKIAAIIAVVRESQGKPS